MTQQTVSIVDFYPSKQMFQIQSIVLKFINKLFIIIFDPHSNIHVFTMRYHTALTKPA